MCRLVTRLEEPPWASARQFGGARCQEKKQCNREKVVLTVPVPGANQLPSAGGGAQLVLVD